MSTIQLSLFHVMECILGRNDVGHSIDILTNKHGTYVYSYWFIGPMRYQNTLCSENLKSLKLRGTFMCHQTRSPLVLTMVLSVACSAPCSYHSQYWLIVIWMKFEPNITGWTASICSGNGIISLQCSVKCAFTHNWSHQFIFYNHSST